MKKLNKLQSFVDLGAYFNVPSQKESVKAPAENDQEIKGKSEYVTVKVVDGVKIKKPRIILGQNGRFATAEWVDGHEFMVKSGENVRVEPHYRDGVTLPHGLIFNRHIYISRDSVSTKTTFASMKVEIVKKIIYSSDGSFREFLLGNFYPSDSPLKFEMKFSPAQGLPDAIPLGKSGREIVFLEIRNK